jgi:glycosyltransferase involved in cell wall biosynthesis
VSGCPGIVVYRAGQGIDSIDEYSRRLVAALRAGGDRVDYAPGGLSSVRVTSDRPPWILLQYNPFRYGRAGFAPRLLPAAIGVRRGTGAPLALMVHEAWIDVVGWRSALVGGWQRAQLRALLRLAAVVMTSTEALARVLGRGAVHVPVASNITPVELTRDAARRRLGLDAQLVVALLGRGNPSRALDHAGAAVTALAHARGARSLVVLNLGADAPPLPVAPGIEVRTPGRMSADELSLHLLAGDLALLPFTDGVSTRRTTVMAALAHGLPVLGLRGVNTDTALLEHPEALTLTPVGEIAAFARAAVELAGDAARLRAAGEAARRLYADRFDWPLVAERVKAALGRLAQ